jgi:hypothetical protein
VAILSVVGDRFHPGRLFGTAEETAEKGQIRHSERSVESLLGGNPRKEGFLTSQTPFGMTG